MPFQVTCEMRPYVPGEDLSDIYSEDDPEPGGMIARNPANYKDKWYVTKDYFENNFDTRGWMLGP